MHGIRYPRPSHLWLGLGEVCHALPELRLPDASSGDCNGVDDAQDEADVDRGVLQPLPCETPEGETVPDPSDEALHHRPQPLVHHPHPLRALHVDAVPHRQNIGRADPAPHTPPSDEMGHLPGLEGFEDTLGFELAVPGEELNLQVLAQNPVEQRLHHALLVHVGGRLHVAQRVTLHIDEEKALVP